jgi:small subunit ribosomal protein S16
MLRIRLSRTGKKKQANFRVVVADADAKRDGRVVERIGHYNPHTEPLEYAINEGRALYWLSVGAQPSDAVERLLVKQGTIDRLGRLRQGEPIEALVAEYDGVELAPAAPAAEMPAAKMPAAEMPVVEEPMAEEPVVEEPVAAEEAAAMVEEPIAVEEAAAMVEEPVAVEEAAAMVEEPVALEEVAAMVEDLVTDEEE